MLPLTYLAKHVPRGGFSTLFIFILCVRARVFLFIRGLLKRKERCEVLEKLNTGIEHLWFCSYDSKFIRE